jgi:hypothetical protein
VAQAAHANTADVPIRKTLPGEDKLDALRKADPTRVWESLDDRRVCVLCEKSFSGRQVEASVGATGRVRLRCPSEGCAGTPREWVRPGKPLISEQAWQAWTHVLEGGKRPRNRTRSKTTAGASYL